MTLEKIQELFEVLYETYPNALELLMALGEHKEEYANSEFAQKTGLSIYEAYELYYKTSLIYSTLLETAQKVIDSIDYTTLNDNLSIDSLFEQMPSNYGEIFKSVLAKEQNK